MELKGGNRKSRTGYSCSAGFTLAELLAVLAIFLLILGVSIPSLNSFNQDLALKNATRKIVSSLRLAQQRTVTEQVKHSVRFTLLGDQYSLIKKNEPEEVLEIYGLPEQIFIDQISGLQNNEAVFNSAGAVDYSGEIYIESNSSDKQTVIEVKPSGYINWQMHDPI